MKSHWSSDQRDAEMMDIYTIMSTRSILVMSSELRGPSYAHLRIVEDPSPANPKSAVLQRMK